MRVIERTIDKHGQHLLVPEIEIEGWWTSLESDYYPYLFNLITN
jgi:hypothetical protein